MSASFPPLRRGTPLTPLRVSVNLYFLIGVGSERKDAPNPILSLYSQIFELVGCMSLFMYVKLGQCTYQFLTLHL